MTARLTDAQRRALQEVVDRGGALRTGAPRRMAERTRRALEATRLLAWFGPELAITPAGRAALDAPRRGGARAKGARTMRTASVRVIARETLPRCQDGVDWGVARAVLVRDAKARKVLFWQRGHNAWACRGRSGYYPGSLVLLDRDDGRSALGALGTTLHEGGRVSRKLLRAHAATVAEFFGDRDLALYLESAVAHTLVVGR